MISVYPQVKESVNATSMDIEDFLMKIKTGYWEDGVKDVRDRLKKAKSKKEKSDIKAVLPNATISGTFKFRKDHGLIEHSGFIAIDFDKVGAPDEVASLLISDPYTFSLFRSVSGLGLCAVVRIPTIHHRESFLALERYYKDQYNLEVDQSCKNESRTRYVSYDPDLYLNKDSQPFTKILRREKEEVGVAKYDNSKIEVSLRYIEANRIDMSDSYEDWMHIGMSFATEFQEAGRSYFHRVSCISSKYDEADCNRKFDNFLKTGRGDIKLGTFFHYCKQNNIPTPELKSDDRFWFVNEDGLLQINNDKLIDFLISRGFRKLYYIENEYKFIQTVNNIVEEVSAPRIKDYLIAYVQTLSGVIGSGKDKKGNDTTYYPKNLRKTLIDKAKTVFSIDKLEFLPNIKSSDFVSGIPDAHFFFFTNGFVKTTSEGWKFYDYTHLDRYIWKNQIIKREITITEPLQDTKDCTFYQFIRRVCSKNHDEIHKNPEDDSFDSEDTKNRIASLMTIYGYLLHEYEEGKKKAIFWTDENQDEDSADGRSGKSLAALAVRHLRDLCNINGKAFRYDNTFKYQSVNLSTQIILLNDIKKNFNMEDLFHDITESTEINKKNKDQFMIRPKFIITANRMVGGAGGSFKDRLIEFEFSSFFSDRWSPQNEFNHWFFSDWAQTEWDKFYNFMFRCCESYLFKLKTDPTSIGMHATDSGNIKLKKLKANTSSDFVLFMRDCFEQKVHIDQKIGLGEPTEGYGIRLDKWIYTDLWHKLFIENFPDQAKYCSQKRFSTFLRAYADYAKLYYYNRRSGGKSLTMISMKLYPEWEESLKNSKITDQKATIPLVQESPDSPDSDGPEVDPDDLPF